MRGELARADMERQPAVLSALPDTPGLGEAAGLLQDARLVRLVGIGSSRHVAGYAAEMFDHAGIPATVLPAPGRAVPLPRLHADDLLVMVSQSGRTPALLELADAAPCRMIAIVNEPHSTLGGRASVELLCEAGREQVVAATASVTAQMLMLRLLVGPVESGGLVAAVSELLDSTLPMGDCPPLHVIAGGLAAQWVAEEVALKLAEMASLSATADSAVDHLHGPAVLDIPSIALLDSTDPNAPHSPKVTMIVSPSTGDPTLDPIVRIVAGQILALQWAESLGVDADDPRGLAKVTVSA